MGYGERIQRGSEARRDPREGVSPARRKPQGRRGSLRARRTCERGARGHVVRASARFAESHGALVEAFTAGCSVRDAACAVGVGERTVKRWLARGRVEPDGPYAAFAAEVDDARGQARMPGVLPLDAQELAVVVSEAARRGNTLAMRLRWDMLRAECAAAVVPAAPVDPLTFLDDLAARRVPR